MLHVGDVLFEDVFFMVVPQVFFVSKFEGLCHLCINNPGGIS